MTDRPIITAETPGPVLLRLLTEEDDGEWQHLQDEIEAGLRLQPDPFIRVQVGPRNATTDPKTGLRFYEWQGRMLPSVTSIRRMAGIPYGLHTWSVGKVVERALDHLPALATRLADADPATVALARKWIRSAPTEERDAAAALGTAVHDAAAAGKTEVEVPPDVGPRLRQYLHWLRESEAVVIASEFQVFNLTIGYAGSADLLCRFPDGSIWLVDIKTGKGVYSEHALQLIAYLCAEFSGSDGVVDQHTTDLLGQAKGMAVLHLADNHWEFRSFDANPDMWRAFRGLLAFGMWMHGHQSADDVTIGRRKGKA